MAITLAIGLSVDFTLHYSIMYKKSRDEEGDGRSREEEIVHLNQPQLAEGGPEDLEERLRNIKQKRNDAKVQFSLNSMAAPISMAAFTTFVAGVCLIPTRVLAYIQIGTFIVIVMTTSWIFATFFFQAVLSVVGPKTTCR